MEQAYKPIDCNFHDVLLDRATRKVVVDLEYMVLEKQQKVQTVFKDVYTKAGEEFLVIDNGETIRLDQIVSVDGLLLPDDSSCGL